MKLRAGAHLDRQLVEVFRGLHLKAQNALSSLGPERHQDLVFDIARTLRPYVTESEIDRLAFTPSYWHIRSGGMFAPVTLQYEFEQIAERLRIATEELAAELKRWEFIGNIVVPDTNVFLHVLTDSIAETDWHALADCSASSALNVVLVITVLDELDRAKLTGARSEAGQTLKEINELSKDGLRATLRPGLHLEIVVPDVDHAPLEIPDNEIIDQALQLGARVGRGLTVKLLTADTGMEMRARAVGQPVKLLEQKPKLTRSQKKQQQPPKQTIVDVEDGPS